MCNMDLKPLRVVEGMQVLCGYLIIYLYVIGVWLAEGQQTNIKRHVFKRDWTMYLSFINYSTFNSDHD